MRVRFPVPPVLALLAAATFLSSPAGAKEVVAIMDLAANNASAGDASVVSEFVRTAAVRIGKYDVVEKKNMERILAEQAFQQTGCTTDECAVKLGKVLNAQKMVVGTYSVFEGTRAITLRLVDVETGKVEKSEMEKGFTPDTVDRAADNAVTRLLGGTPAWARSTPPQQSRSPATQVEPMYALFGCCAQAVTATCAVGIILLVVALAR